MPKKPYILDRPPIRPTPDMTEDDYVEWCEHTNRYHLKLVLPDDRKPGVCPVYGCGRSVKSDGTRLKCNPCRKYISVMNNPILRVLGNMRSNAHASGADLDVTEDQLNELLRKKKLWDTFMKDPYSINFRRNDVDKGFTIDNIHLEVPELSWV